MNPDSLIWLIVGGLAATCFAGVGARALRDFSRHDLEEVCRRRKRQEVFAEILRLHDRIAQGVENLVALLSTLLVVAATYWVGFSDTAGARPGWGVLALDTLAFGAILSATVLWIPWAISELWAAPFLARTWRLWHALGTLMRPLVWGAAAVDVVLHRLAGRQRELPTEEHIEEEIRTIVTEGHREGLLEEDAREMIEGIIELGDADVSQVMTPRTDLDMMAVDTPWDEMVQYVIKVGHTRIPVYRKNRDDIIGILYSKDLLPELSKPSGERRRGLAEILRKPHFVPETKKVDDLLEEFQQTRNHMAVVLDEYGGVSGLVTIEDVLEEIVGEIVDEYDEEAVEEIKRLDEQTCEVLGRVHVDEINEEMGLDLPDDGDFDTIGGFVFSELGRVPTAGESLDWRDEARITVLEATGRRIERLRIALLGRESREIA